MRILFYAVLFLIAYGSFYPFDVSLAAMTAEETVRLFTSWKFYSGRGDVLGNVALFVPYGFFGLLAMPRGRRFAGACLALSVFGVIFAALLQVAQLVIVSRDAEMGDVVWNLLGIVAGAFAARPRRIRDLFDGHGGVGAVQAVPLVLLGCWAVATLAPFVPSIDFQSFKDSLKPLLSGSFGTAEFVRETVSWLIVALVGTEVARLLPPGPWRSDRIWLPALMAGTVLARILIVQNEVTLSQVLAIAVAFPGWFAATRLEDRTPRFLLSLLCIMIFVTALEPFGFRDTSASFNWIPFAGSLSGSMAVNAKVIAGKLFAIGALFYLCRRCGYAMGTVTLATMFYLLALEILQVWIGNHTPEITDPLLAGLAGLVFVSMGDRIAIPDGFDRTAPAVTADAPPTPAAEARAARAETASGPEMRRRLILLAAGCVLAAILMNIVLGLPKIPYNVRELFGGEDSWWRLFVFALGVSSIGMGGAWAGTRIGPRLFPAVRLPALVVLACFVTFLLFRASVTAESLADIVGSSNTFYYVTEQDLWGPTAKSIFLIVGTTVVSWIERVIRFVALFGPVLFWIAIMVAVAGPGAPRGAVRAGMRFAGLAICALPWLWLFKFIAFTRASTDNLNELIQDNGAMLYPLLVLLPATALVLVRAAQRPRPGTILRALAILAVSLPVGWFFLTHGLADEVRKYDKVFSGVDFLLGPDRAELLSRTTLMARWFAVQILACLALAFGMYVGLPRRPAPVSPIDSPDGPSHAETK